jgi:hypothetical protein
VNGSGWRSVMWAVNENTHTGDTLAFVVEIGLDVHSGGGLVLTEIRKAMAVVVQIVNELAFERRCWIEAPSQPLVLLVSRPAVFGFNDGPCEFKQRIADLSAIDAAMFELLNRHFVASLAIFVFVQGDYRILR